MDNDRLAQIEKRLVKLAACNDAHAAVLQIIVGRMAMMTLDWRDELDGLRMAAEAGFWNTNDHTSLLDAARLQLLGRQHIEEMFSVVHNALLACENLPDKGESDSKP